MSDYAGTHSKI